jgi:hypothetical protein
MQPSNIAANATDNAANNFANNAAKATGNQQQNIAGNKTLEPNLHLYELHTSSEASNNSVSPCGMKRYPLNANNPLQATELRQMDDIEH